MVTSSRNPIAEQAEIESTLLAEYQAGSYTLQNPYIVQDLYGNSPLTALVLFETQTPAVITVWVKGKTPSADLRYSFKNPALHHEIPIIGLYSGIENTIVLSAQASSGEIQEHAFILQTEPAPDDFPERTVVTARLDEMEPGWLLVNSDTYKYILDYQGEIRWYFSFKSNNIFTLLPDNNFVVSYLPDPPYSYGDPAGNLVTANWLGKFAMQYFLPPVHHDLIPYNDIYLATVGEDVYQFDPQTGFANSSSVPLQDFFPAERIYPYMDNYQSLHVNALVTDGDFGDDLLVSVRNQNALIRFSYPDGPVKWILGNPADWPAAYQQELLRPVGDDFEWFWLQHAPKILPDADHNQDTTDILVFDNGAYRDNRPEIPSAELYSRMVIYRIHEKERTVEQLWQYGKERGPELFSSIKGDAEYLNQSGNYLGTFAEVPSQLGAGMFDAVIVEVTSQKEVVFELRLTDTQSIYRSQIINLADRINETAVGQNQAKYLQNGYPYTVYTYPARVRQLDSPLDAAFMFCRQKIGVVCDQWANRAQRIALTSIHYSQLDIQYSTVKITDWDLFVNAKVALPENSQNLNMVLSGDQGIYIFDVSPALFGEPDSDNLTKLYINYFNLRTIPTGVYKLRFIRDTAQGISESRAEYIIETPK